MNQSNLNDIAAEALEIFRQKLAGQIIDEQYFHEARKSIALAATNDGYSWGLQRYGTLMTHAQHLIDQAKPPLADAVQTDLLARFQSWIEQRLAEAAKASGKTPMTEDKALGRGAVVSSGSHVKKIGRTP